MAIITTSHLAPWVKPTKEQLDNDPLAQAVINRASLLVNETVWGVTGQANYWTVDDPDRQPPETAQSIAEQLAARVFSNPRVVQQRATGPMSERLADVVLTSMALRPDEVERLLPFRTGGNAGPTLWIQPTFTRSGTTSDDTVAYVDAYFNHPAGVTYFPSDYDHA